MFNKDLLSVQNKSSQHHRTKLRYVKGKWAEYYMKKGNKVQNNNRMILPEKATKRPQKKVLQHIPNMFVAEHVIEQSNKQEWRKLNKGLSQRAPGLPK